MSQIEEIKSHLRGERKWWQCPKHRPLYAVYDSGEGEGRTWFQALNLPVHFQNEGGCVCAEAVFLWKEEPRAQSVIFCIDLSILNDEDRLQQLKESFKQRLNALHQRRFLKIPLYFVFTGLEKVEGFAHYKERLQPGEEKQILGASFEGSDVKAELKALHKQLESKILAQLSWDNTKKAENQTILFFPQTLAQYYDKVVGFVQNLLSSLENAKERFLLRGLYFTALPTQENKAYFAEAIYTQVLHKEKKLSHWKQGILEYVETHHKAVWSLSLLAVLLIVGLSWGILLWIEAPAALPPPPPKLVAAPVVKPVEIKKPKPPKPIAPTLNCNSSISISMTPMILSKNLAKFSVTFGNQGFFYQNGPRFLSVLNWTRNASAVTVQFTGLDGSILNQSYSGGSGLIRFLSSGSESPIDSTHTALTFSDGPYSATYAVSVTPGTLNEVLALKNLHCNQNF